MTTLRFEILIDVDDDKTWSSGFARERLQYLLRQHAPDLNPTIRKMPAYVESLVESKTINKLTDITSQHSISGVVILSGGTEFPFLDLTSEYMYRNTVFDDPEISDSWIIVGVDLLNDRTGILEMCFSGTDARLTLLHMLQYKKQFKDLVMMPYSAYNPRGKLI